MVSVNFISEGITEFDDIEYSWKVTNRFQTFIVTATFCGGIDEDGNKNLYSSICCDIAIQETYRSKKIPDANVLNVLLNKLGEVAYDIGDDKDGLQYLVYKNEDSYDGSVKQIFTILRELAGLLMEMPIDPFA